VNKDDDGAEVSGNLPPPPKMGPRMHPSPMPASPSPAPASPAPNPNTSLTAPPPLGGSGYKLGRSELFFYIYRTQNIDSYVPFSIDMRKNYVNVLQQNGSAASSPTAAPSNLFPGMASNQPAPPVNLFVPAPGKIFTIYNILACFFKQRQFWQGH